MGNILNYIQENVEDYDYLIRRIAISILVILLLWLIQFAISRVVDKYAKKEITVRRLTRASRIILTVLAVAFIIYTWFYSLEAVGILLAIFAFLILISIQDVMVDMTYYFYILVKRPFKIGDIVEMKDITGIIDDIDIIQIRLMELGNITHNLEPTGRMFTVPNRTFFEDKVFNYTYEQPYIIQDINILVDFDSDIDKAIRLAGEVAYERYNELLESYDEDQVELFKRQLKDSDHTISPQVWSELDDNGFRIYIRYFSHVQELAVNKRALENRLYEAF